MIIFKSKRYKHFKRKLKSIEHAIWDQEFKRFKTLEIREGKRKEYDGTKAQIQLLEEKYKKEKKNDKLKKGDLERIKDDKTRAEANRDKFEEQLKGLDKEVSGSKPSDEEPNGTDGIEQTLSAYRELVETVRDYMKNL